MHQPPGDHMTVPQQLEHRHAARRIVALEQIGIDQLR